MYRVYPAKNEVSGVGKMQEERRSLCVREDYQGVMGVCKF